MIIKINEKDSSQRLDKFLTEQLKDLSRNQIQKLIKQSAVVVNNLPVSAHYNLQIGDKIAVKNINLAPAKKIEKKPAGKAPDIKVIKAMADYLVINKPAGLAVHGKNDFTLADWLKTNYPKIKSVGDDPERPGIVHRLDKDVSGLMVIALNQKSFASLKKQFQERNIIKEYIGLTHGQISKEYGLINFPIRRSADGYKMAALPLTFRGAASNAGREAITEFEVIKKLVNYTLLKIKIKTGRTHQIRVHLAAYDHPLVGDNIYATAKTRIQNKKLGLGRVFLVADRLSFIDLTGDRQDFKINLTLELKNLLKKVK